jgi:hypothetical protein
MMKLNDFNDTQNVYNYAIQLCVRDSINRITTRSDLKNIIPTNFMFNTMVKNQ